MIKPFPNKKYKTIYADPAWELMGGGKYKRGANRHYKILSTKHIISMSPAIHRISEENSHLYLWVANNFLKDGLMVMEEWGFRYVNVVTWVKDRIGLGKYFRNRTEHCLFGVKGKLPFKEPASTLIEYPRTKHSKKPDIMYDYIEKVSYPSYIELFARQKRPGWDSWGNDINVI